RHTRFSRDWSSDVCSSDLGQQAPVDPLAAALPAPPKPPVFSALDTFIVNLQPEMGEQYLQVAITLQLEEQAQADQIKTYMPMVQIGSASCRQSVWTSERTE